MRAQLRLRIPSRFSGWPSRFSGWPSRFSGWPSRFSGWPSRFSGWIVAMQQRSVANHRHGWPHRPGRKRLHIMLGLQAVTNRLTCRQISAYQRQRRHGGRKMVSQSAKRPSESRITILRRHVTSGTDHKLTSRVPRMGNGQRVTAAYQLSMQHHVQVDRPRIPAASTLSSQLIFDRL